MTAPPGLTLSADLTLPLDVVTETIAILAKRGAGKSYTASVLAEEIIGAGYPTVVIDPLGVWWGLRAAADGDGEGLPVVIFGGDHADVPLDEKAGDLVADVIVSERISAIIDLSLLSKSASRRFLEKFVAHLYRTNRDPLHVIVDEADAFAPQSRLSADGAALLGAMEDLVRRGRVRGLGTTLITQRPAVLHKDVLTQAGILVAMRMTGPRDVAAIDEWVRLHAEPDTATTVKASLPSLPVGTAWVWAPGYDQELTRVAVRRRTTFDSSATPKVGQKRLVPRRMASVDIKRLGDQFAEAVREAEANDPKALKARIKRLEKDLAAQPAARPAPAPDPVEVKVEVEVPVLTDEQQDLLADLVAGGDRIGVLLEEFNSGVSHLLATIETSTASRPTPSTTPVPRPPARPSRRAQPSPVPAQTQQPTEPADGEPVALRAGARRMVDVLAANHPRRLTRYQLGTLAHLKSKSGTFTTYLGDLRRNGLLDETAAGLGLTDAGLAASGVEVGVPLSKEEVIEQYRSTLRAGARAMFDHLIDIHPETVDRPGLAEAAGLTPGSGTFTTYLGDLRRNGLLDESQDRQIRANDVLFD